MAKLITITGTIEIDGVKSIWTTKNDYMGWKY